MKTLIAIPARYASTRYPGKPLVTLRGPDGDKTLIRRSWEAAMAVRGIDRVVVATDDARIADHAAGFGAEVVMTSSDARNGTERCAEVAAQLPGFDVVVNLQGDAPLTPAWFVEDLVAGLAADPAADIATPGPALRRPRGGGLSGRPAGRARGRHHGGLWRRGPGAVLLERGHPLHRPRLCPGRADAGLSPCRRLRLPPRRADGLSVLADRPAGNAGGAGAAAFPGKQPPGAVRRGSGPGRQFWELNNPSDVAVIEAMLAQLAAAD
jgi:3-deoxy-manno-octulosonate cytidylyltransferase (CMP-KDO synthetase)